MLHWLGRAFFCHLLLTARVALAGLPDEVDGEPVPSLAPMLERVTPSVVNIATYARVRLNNPLLNDPFFRRFFQVPERRRTQSAGSGVVIDAGNGYVVTNHHVVDGAEEIWVTLADGRKFEARLLGIDPQVDLAALKIDGGDLVELPYADSHALRVGDFVVAIGNPFGFDQTVTSGIVSALGRGLGIQGYENFIQTDASINRGNSGGALVDLKGRLVGINTAIVAPSGGSVGIGFAIPSNMVQVIVEELIKHGRVRRARIGVEVQSLTRDLADALGVPHTDGVVVVDVEPGSIAESAGVLSGDVLKKIDGRTIRGVSDFASEEAMAMIGDELSLEVLRGDAPQTLTLAIDDNRVVAGVRLDERLTGADLTDFRGDEDPTLSEGVYVGSVERGSRAHQQGLRTGDVILGVNGVRVVNVGELARELREGARTYLRVYRAGRTGDIPLH